MKKLLALLLALALLLVNVAAFAENGDTNPVNDPPAATEGGSEGGSENDPPAGTEGGSEGGSGTDTGSGTGSAAAAPAATAAYEPGTGADAGSDTVGSPRVLAGLQNGGSITLDKVYALTILDNSSRVPYTDIVFETELVGIVNSTADVTEMQKDENLPSVSFTPSQESGKLSGNSYTDPNKITVSFPTYPEVGIYTYTVTEKSDTDKEYAGVTYSDPITMKVTVIRQNNELVIAGVAFRLAGDSTKLGEITNEYKAGGLTVKKQVAGNMGDQNKEFTITVAFQSEKTVNSTIAYTVNGGEEQTIAPSAWSNGETSVEVTLKHGQDAVFTNIPDDVTYTVVENDENNGGAKHVKNSTDEQDNVNAYKVEGEVGAEVDGVKQPPKAITVADNTEEIITNTKDIDIDTGVALDSLPYVLLMALTLAGFVLMTARRRREEY